MIALLYLVVAICGVVVGSTALVAIPDPMIRASVVPTGFTLVFLAAGTLLLFRSERRLVGDRSGVDGVRPRRTLDDRPPAPVPASSENDTNEPKPIPAEPTLPAVVPEPVTAGQAPAFVAFAPAPPTPQQDRAANEIQPDPPSIEPPSDKVAGSAATSAKMGTFSPFGGDRRRVSRRPPSARLVDASIATKAADRDVQAATIDPAGAAATSMRQRAEQQADLLDTPDSRAESVARAIDNDALETLLTPVVSLPQRRRRMVHLRLECRHFGKLTDARALLEGSDGPLHATLDFELIRAAVAAVERPRPGSENLPVMAFVESRSFASEEALAALRRQIGRRDPNWAQLQLILTDWSGDQGCQDMLATLRQAGVVVGVEFQQQPILSPEAIAGRGLGLICITGAELQRAALSAYDTDLIRDIKAMQRRGIEVVVTGIADERTLAEVLDYPVQLGTGSLFGRIG